MGATPADGRGLRGRRLRWLTPPVVAFALVVSSVFVVAGLSGTGARSAVQSAAPPRPVLPRVGAWTAALAGGGQRVHHRTVRMVVHPTIGGTGVRVRLSNRYGTGPLPVGAVDVAVQAHGGDAVPGTHHTATFSGAGATTIPAGRDAATDPLAMTVNADENLLVSVYFPGDAGASGRHWLAAETTYYSAPGDFAAVFDLSTALRDPARPHRLSPAYDSGDHLHPDDAGYRAMANAIDLRTLTDPLTPRAAG
ncbi:hypothetical protein [Streptomyces sp. NPDC008139]|uniref:hypothetical protein n=1 Tax=Streptomyces sp. NPDC008139 TaxID=3364814 RepID=UPI0036ED247B